MKFGKVDVAAGIVIALAFFLGFFNLGLCGILVLIVLIVADDREVIKNVISAFLFNMFIALLANVLYKVSGCYGGIGDFLRTWIRNSDNYTTIDTVIKWLDVFDIAGFINKVLDLFTLVMAIIYSIKALKGKDIKVMFVNKLACKIAGIEVEQKSNDEEKSE